MNESSRVIDARQHVLAGIESGRFQPGERLPSVRKLAVEAKVSLVTMWKAVGELKQDGHLVARAGGIARVAGQPAPTGPSISSFDRTNALAGSRGGARHRLTNRIRTDLLNGLYRPGTPLPQMKQLQRTYATSWRSLRGVLAMLCSEGVIEARGRHFGVPGSSSTVTDSTIGLLAMDEYLELYYLGMPQGHDYIRDTQLYASQAGVRLVVEAFQRTEESGLDVDKDSLLFSDRSDVNILGYILILSEANGIDHLLRKIVRTNKPLAIVEQNGYWRLPAWLRQYPVLAMSAGISADCGAMMGRHLLGLGHKKAAFFSPYHPSPWSVARHRGLCATFEQAGLTDAVLACFAVPDTLFSADTAFRGDRAAVPRLQILWPKGHREFAMRKEAHRLEGMLQAKLDGAVALRGILDPLFARALTDEHITAWVGANDEIAAAALEFLQTKGVKVPREISVAGFDDSFCAVANQITSFNFNIPAIMSAAIQHVIGGSRRAPAVRARIENIDGMVIERKTTGGRTARVGADLRSE